MRPDGRALDEIRPVKITRHFSKYAEGSVLIEVGDTKVICTASIEERVPPFLKGSKKGWITAEYSMLPRATATRTIREAAKGKQTGRTQEIQRLIGRSLRAVLDMDALGERTVWLDCDVIQADGGTRTAAITGSYVALVDALQKLVDHGTLKSLPITDYLAAVSMGVWEGKEIIDLCYAEDSHAEVDMNLVMTAAGKIVEIQGTAEAYPFSREQLNILLHLGEKGIQELIAIQKNVLGEA